MDEADAQVSIDLGGRPFLVFEGEFPRERVGELPTELVPHFFRSLAETLGAAIHVRVRGENAHHMVEACFKGVARALRQAIARRRRRAADDEGHAVNARRRRSSARAASNLASLGFALKRLGVDAPVTADPRARAPRHARDPAGRRRRGRRMARLARRGLAEVVPTLTQPVLGICLGMQLLFAGSDEGRREVPRRDRRARRAAAAERRLAGAADGLERDRCGRELGAT